MCTAVNTVDVDANGLVVRVEDKSSGAALQDGSQLADVGFQGAADEHPLCARYLDIATLSDARGFNDVDLRPAFLNVDANFRAGHASCADYVAGAEESAAVDGPSHDGPLPCTQDHSPSGFGVFGNGRLMGHGGRS